MHLRRTGTIALAVGTLLTFVNQSGVEVRLSHDRIHAEDCAECETREGYLDEIRKEIRLSGPLDDEQRERLLEIARRCPVNLTLQREVRIVDSLSSE